MEPKITEKRTLSGLPGYKLSSKFGNRIDVELMPYTGTWRVWMRKANHLNRSFKTLEDAFAYARWIATNEH